MEIRFTKSDDNHANANEQQKMRAEYMKQVAAAAKEKAAQEAQAAKNGGKQK